MTQRIKVFIALVITLLGGLFLLGTSLRAADPTPILCPNGQTVFLEGQAPPREPLLSYLSDRAVGGGISDSQGFYRVPLRAQERPGIYPVEVRLRSNRAVVGTFTCYVDLPLDTQPTPTLDPGAVSPGPTRSVTPTASPTQPTRQPVGTGTAGTTTITATRATTTPGTTTPGTTTPGTTTPGTTTPGTTTPGTPTSTATGGTSSTSSTATVTRTTGTQSGTAQTPSATGQAEQVEPGDVEIDDITLSDPGFPGEDDEYVRIINVAEFSINLRDWRLRNITHSVPDFVFPNFDLPVDGTVAVYSGTGTNSLSEGKFYWNRPGVVWRIGDQAQLLDATGAIISEFEVR